MKISKAHQKFADRLNDQTALEYPERFLGPNWKNVLNFWIYLDTLSYEDRLLIGRSYFALDDRLTIMRLTRKAAVDTIGYEYAIAAIGWAATAAAVAAAYGYVTLELISSHNLESLEFLPLFLKL